ncbi:MULTISPECIES: helix-turn-helix transcriptional regulator [Actinomycetes]|uniref:transcriptional regulator n=1 Tax=Actinomycetes TaxID=1760 RepID=UPI0011AF373A|nr:helix-turn-helix transcriptional regulator [Streptomyces noursei]
MARPMNALPTGDGHDRHLVDFAEALRALRQRASHPSLAEMSERSGVCIASLSGAHNGRTLPTWRTVEGYVRACGADPEPWRSRWENLRLTQRTDTCDKHAAVLKRWARTGQLTPPQWVKSEAELARLLDHMRRFRGLSLRDLARYRAGFSHHTYGAVLRGDRPMSTAMLIALLGACKVGPGPTERWVSILAVVRPSEWYSVESWRSGQPRHWRPFAMNSGGGVIRDRARRFPLAMNSGGGMVSDGERRFY